MALLDLPLQKSTEQRSRLAYALEKDHGTSTYLYIYNNVELEGKKRGQGACSKWVSGTAQIRTESS